MVARWLSRTFQSFLDLFRGGPTPEDAENNRLRSAHSRGRENQELFDNKFRREAQEHAELKDEYFKRADEARADGDHVSANKHVNKVGLWVKIGKSGTFLLFLSFFLSFFHSSFSLKSTLSLLL